MKIKLLLSLSILSGMLGCTPEPSYSLRFCDVEQVDTCEPDENIFELGKKIYVKLSSEQRFETGKVTGTVFKLMNGKKVKMGSKEFDISPDERYIKQDIPFDEFGMQALGNFEVEFTDENGQPIAVEQLEIIQP